MRLPWYELQKGLRLIVRGPLLHRRGYPRWPDDLQPHRGVPVGLSSSSPSSVSSPAHGVAGLWSGVDA